MKQGYNVSFYVWFELCNVLGILTDTAGELTLKFIIIHYCVWEAVMCCAQGYAVSKMHL